MSVKKNFIYNLSYQILVMILPLITTPYISRVIGAEGVGIQSYTYSIANYFVLFAMLGVNNHGNRSIAMVRNDQEKLNRTFTRFAMFISIGAMFGLIGVGKSIVPAFLGKGFERCIEVVSLLSITLLFMAWANVIRTQILIPKKKDRVYIISTLLGAIVNVVINTLLITKWGAIGAAIGTIFAEATVCIYQTLMVRKELDIKNYLNNNVIFIISGIIMFLVIKYIEYILGNSLLTGVIQIFIGASVYCIISVIYMIIVKYELIINIINKRK